MVKTVVKKFGGTSVGSPVNMKGVMSIIGKDNTPIRIVVLSALSGTTNQLLSLIDFIKQGDHSEAKKVIVKFETHYHDFLIQLFSPKKEEAEAVFEHIKTHFFAVMETYITHPPQHLSETVVAMGEQMSTFIFSKLLTSQGIDHLLLDALTFMKIDENEQPDFFYTEEHLRAILSEYSEKLVITQGFICRNHLGHISNLKRGGSDYTASIIAACVDAVSCEIWTDIDGIHNNDPRVVSNTHSIKSLTFDEASELAYFGAKILHPTCILPAQRKSIPVKILNTMKPDAHGTVVSDNPKIEGAKAIAAKDNITSIRIVSAKMLMAYGFLTKVFHVFEKYKTPIDMITTSEVAVSVTIDNTTHLDSITEELSDLGNIIIEHKHTIISIVVYNLNASTDLLKKVFSSLDHLPIRMICYGGSKNNISLLVEEHYKAEVLQKLNASIF